MKLTLELTQDQVAEIAEQVAELVAKRQHSTADDEWLRGAKAIAAHIASPPSRVYALARCTPPRIPVHRDGSNLIAKRSKLDQWIIEHGGGKRP